MGDLAKALKVSKGMSDDNTSGSEGSDNNSDNSNSENK